MTNKITIETRRRERMGEKEERKNGEEGDMRGRRRKTNGGRKARERE